jgi:phage terminase large subunit GpA-like protein
MSVKLIDREFFAQITAEKRVKTYKHGFPVPIYKKTRPRNEALDCWVYAIAALEILRPNFKAIASKLIAKIKGRKGNKTTKKKAKTKKKVDALSVENVAKVRRVIVRRPKRKGFIKRY